MAKKSAIVNRSVCVSCGACTKVCPQDALSVVGGMYALADAQSCVGCGLCSKICPAGAITIESKGEQQ